VPEKHPGFIFRVLGKFLSGLCQSFLVKLFKGEVSNGGNITPQFSTWFVADDERIGFGILRENFVLCESKKKEPLRGGISLAARTLIFYIPAKVRLFCCNR